jgi:hypothetical protein
VVLSNRCPGEHLKGLTNIQSIANLKKHTGHVYAIYTPRTENSSRNEKKECAGPADLAHWTDVLGIGRIADPMIVKAVTLRVLCALPPWKLIGLLLAHFVDKHRQITAIAPKGLDKLVKARQQALTCT